MSLKQRVLATGDIMMRCFEAEAGAACLDIFLLTAAAMSSRLSLMASFYGGLYAMMRHYRAAAMSYDFMRWF